MDSDTIPTAGQPALDVSNDPLRVMHESLVAQFPQIMRAIAAEVSDVWGTYVEFAAEHHTQLSDAAQVVIPALLTTATGHALDEPVPQPEMDPGVAGMFEEIGRAQFREDRDLTTLLTEYQAGALVAWEHISRAAVAAGLDSERMSLLAKTLLVVVQDLSARTSDGFVREQSWFGSASHRAQGELAGILLAATPDLAVIQNAADRAGWVIPDQVAFVLLADQDKKLDDAARIDPEWMLVHVEDLTGCVIPWVVGIEKRLRGAFRASGAVVGTPMPVTQCRRSMSHARNARRLQQHGVLTGSVIFVADHFDTILVHRNPELLAALRERVLAPVAHLPPGTQERMLTTLASWLRNMGSRSAIASELHIHPQTVRYRVEQLREIFGSAMEDPEQRNQLFMALVWGAPTPSD